MGAGWSNEKEASGEADGHRRTADLSEAADEDPVAMYTLRSRPVKCEG
jgi:hypothetical protein